MERNWTQTRLHVNSGVPLSTIAAIEAARSRGEAATIEKIARAFGVEERHIRDFGVQRKLELLSLKLRDVVENYVLQSKMWRGRIDPSGFVQDVKNFAAFLSALHEARSRIGTVVQGLHELPIPREKHLTRTVLREVLKAERLYETMMCKLVGTSADYHNARALHEIGKLKHVGGLIARTKLHAARRMEDPDGVQEWHRRSLESFDKAQESCSKANDLKRKAGAGEDSLLATRVKLLEVKLEKMLVDPEKVSLAELDALLLDTKKRQDAFDQVLEPDIRENGQANCQYLEAKICYSRATRMRRLTPDDVKGAEEKIRRCETLSGKLLADMKKQENAEGKFWVEALLAKCSLERLWWDPQNAELQDEAARRYSRALERVDRPDRSTLRSVCILVWLYEDLEKEPVEAEPWARELRDDSLSEPLGDTKADEAEISDGTSLMPVI